MARQREFDEDKVLDALRDVFWEHGYNGTSYANIMEATGLQKGSLYAAFGDKRALYQKAIARYDAQVVSAGVKMLRNEGLSVKVRIENLMNGPVEAAGTREGRHGCLLCNAAIDQAPTDKATEKSVKDSMTRLNDAIAFALGDQEKAKHILASYFGARVLVKAGMDKETLETVRDQTLAVI
jgi:TetR/AcrR family transcriptional repressor of nem operon